MTAASAQRAPQQAVVHYEIVPSSGILPPVDLSLSTLGAVCGTAIGNQHLYWTGLYGGTVAKVFRVGIFLALPSYFFQSSIGTTLALIASLFISLTCLNELCIMRYHLFKLLLGTFDFWFLLGLNTLYCVFGCLILGDLRGLVAVTSWIGIVVAIAIDTIIMRRKERRVSILIASAVAVVFSCGFALRLVDRMRMVTFTLTDGVQFSGVDFAVNATATIGMALLKTAVRAWQSHIEPSAGEYFDESVVKCLLYRCTLSLRETEEKREGGQQAALRDEREMIGGGRKKERGERGGEGKPSLPLTTLPPSTARATSIILSPIESPSATVTGERQQGSYETQLQLCPPRVSSLRSDDTLLVSPPYLLQLFLFSDKGGRGGQVLRRLLWAGLALVGLCCPIVTMIDAKTDECSPLDQRLTVLSVIGLIATLLFMLSFASILNRRLLSWLLRSFDFHFSSAQASLACLAICDIFCWDERTIALFCVWLWFHWILLLDCLTPAWKARVGFTKSLAVPIQCLLTLGQLWMIYELYFAPRPDFRNRLVFEGKINSKGASFKVELYTFTTSRLLTQAVLSSRVLLKLCYRQEDELILLQGDVEYANLYVGLHGKREKYFALRHSASDTSSSSSSSKKNCANKQQKKRKVTVGKSFGSTSSLSSSTVVPTRGDGEVIIGGG